MIEPALRASIVAFHPLLGVRLWLTVSIGPAEAQIMGRHPTAAIDTCSPSCQRVHQQRNGRDRRGR
jgi:hypothetical protein